MHSAETSGSFRHLLLNSLTDPSGRPAGQSPLCPTATFLRDQRGLYTSIKYPLHKALGFLRESLFGGLQLLKSACKQNFNLTKRAPRWRCLNQATASHAKEKDGALKKSFFNPALCDISISILDTKAAVETVRSVVGGIWGEMNRGPLIY